MKIGENGRSVGIGSQLQRADGTVCWRGAFDGGRRDRISNLGQATHTTSSLPTKIELFLKYLVWALLFELCPVQETLELPVVIVALHEVCLLCRLNMSCYFQVELRILSKNPKERTSSIFKCSVSNFSRALVIRYVSIIWCCFDIFVSNKRISSFCLEEHAWATLIQYVKASYCTFPPFFCSKSRKQ